MESTFPNQLKHATITLVIKNTNFDPDYFKNYRPSSNTPYLVLEKAAFYQVNDHLINNGFYCPNQSGYKQHHSCETALLRIVSDIQEVLSKNCLAAILMLDLLVAFDTIDYIAYCLSWKIILILLAKF